MSGATVRKSLPFGMLLTFFALLVLSVAMKSPTVDEQNHIARGLAYLKTGDLRLSQEHPPGINAWEAWPLLLDPRIRLPLDTPSWANAEWYGFADQLLWWTNDHPQSMVFATRVPVMWLSLLLAALTYRWARELAGPWAGLIALCLTVFDPNILAHGRLTTTDMGVTVTVLATAFALWRALGSGVWRRWIVAGAALGAAQMSKFSALALLPVVVLSTGLVWVVHPKDPAKGRARQALSQAPQLLVSLAVALVVIWGGYGFTWGHIGTIGGVGPAPAYWDGIRALLQRTSAGNWAFLMGQYSREGWWYYFPVAFALKTPLPTLIMLALGVGAWARRRISTWANRQVGLARSGTTNTALCLLLPVLMFWGMAMGGSFNIGYRHLLPVLPLLYIWTGWQLGPHVGAWTGSPSRAPISLRRYGSAGLLVSSTCAFLLLCLALRAISIAPHYLAFFNVLAGGPDGGYRFLVDSNLDWGQDLPGLARYVRQHGIERIYLSWFGAAHPEAYDIPFHPLPGFWRFGGEPAAYGFNPLAPAPGTYAISVTNLQGLMFQDHDLYAWFRERTPIAHIGHSIRIYQVEESLPPDQAVVLGVPVAQLAEQEQALLQRAYSVRRFGPATGLILPGESSCQTAWIISPEPIEGAQRVRDGPGYLVLKSACGLVTPPEIQPAPHFEPFVTLWGFHAPEQVALGKDTHLTIDVQWRVDQPPHHSATSFAHLLDAQGRYVSGWDGVVAPATCWQQGDTLRQSYSIPLSAELPPGTYQIEVGWYDAETDRRWPCSVGGEHSGDRFLLPDVEIRR